MHTQTFCNLGALSTLSFRKRSPSHIEAKARIKKEEKQKLDIDKREKF